MNKRIADLMRSKGLHKNISEDCQHRMEMLADLIVFECIKLAVFNGDAATGRAIKEHFGVKE
jgi:hypothetical protein